METRNGARAARDGNAGSPWTRWLQRNAVGLTPWGLRRFVCLPWSLVAPWLLLLVGLIVQGIVIALVYQLVDLSISLMEVWAELARKHLELTL